METKKEPWFGTLWAEFFISIIGAKLIQAIWLSDVGLVIILPILWLIIHFSFGKWIEKWSKKDLFGRDGKV